MEFKGTKGKWTVDKPFKNYDGNVFIDINSEKTKFENCNGSRGGYLIARTYKNAVLKNEQKANAKLIASAPEMFEMLKDIYEQEELKQNYRDVIFELLTKITK